MNQVVRPRKTMVISPMGVPSDVSLAEEVPQPSLQDVHETHSVSGKRSDELASIAAQGDKTQNDDQEGLGLWRRRRRTRRHRTRRRRTPTPTPTPTPVPTPLPTPEP